MGLLVLDLHSAVSKDSNTILLPLYVPQSLGILAIKIISQVVN